LAALAPRPQRIRLGTYVTLLPLHNPIRVAEDAATVDIISNGRLDLGFGAIALPRECESFGVNIAESFGRSYEALTIIERCFTEDEFDYRGKYFNFPKVRMTTKPVQKPGVPIYMGVVAPQSIERAARRGYHFAAALMGPHWRKYGETQRQLGRSRDSYRIVSGPFFVHVAETKDKAWVRPKRGSTGLSTSTTGMDLFIVQARV
jgi:alkanesulfonate monooxygenase SsuD/methylene tetrahydromethanopterin reductase-like flavin-dependent oxidoreductase (luciferase family)